MPVPSGYTGESHPEVWKRPACAAAGDGTGTVRKPGQLTPEQLDQYYNDGYLIVSDFFTDEEIDACCKETEKLVDELAEALYAAGKVKDKYANHGFFERLSMLEKEFPGSNIILHKHCKLPQSYRHIAAHGKLLNLLEDLLGPNISFSPIWNLRTKTPNSEAVTVPWHQDCAYMDNDAYRVMVATAWLPFLDTNRENGTLQFVRGAHAQARVARHTCCSGDTWYTMLDDDTMRDELGADIEKDVVTCNVRKGSFILFNNFIPHRSLNNASDKIRWSIDFRWQTTGTPGCSFGLKEAMPVRKGDQTTYVPDFDAFDNVDRNKEQLETMKYIPTASEADPFNTIVSGPWVKKWEVVNSNRHTASFVDDPKYWDVNTIHG